MNELKTYEKQNNVDLNSKIFYKLSFNVELLADYKDIDLLWEVVLLIKKWLEYKGERNGQMRIPSEMKLWSRFKYGGIIFDSAGQKNFYAESIRRVNNENENDIAWACRIRECQVEKKFAPRWWNTEIGFQTLGNNAAKLSFVVSYGDAMGFIGECLPTPDISVPRIVSNIQRDKRFYCSVNGDPLLLEAIEYRSGKGEILKEQIYDKKRGVPLILIMPKKDYVNPDNVNLPVDPQEMIKSVAGNALVYYSTDLSFVGEFNEFLNKDYRCTTGMIRYYLPHIDENDKTDSFRHRFIHYDEAVELGEVKITKIFRRVVAQDINDYDNLFRFRDCQELLRKDDLQARINTLNREKNESIKYVSEEKENFELEKLEYQIRIDDLESEKNDLQKRNYNLEAKVDSIMATYEPLKVERESYDRIREMQEYPGDPNSILVYFTTVFSDRIDITQEGWKSLKECTTSPNILWDVLYSMVTILYDCLEKCDSFAEACSQYNNKSIYECVAGNTATTKKNRDIMKDFQVTYNGELINIEAHLKSKTGKESDPKFFRIYFNNYLDKKTNKRLIVIGSCGRHKTTAGTMHSK